MAELIETGVPTLAHVLHDELDRTSGSYLWNFLDENWDALEAGGLTERVVLDRLLHRRASVQLGRLDDTDGAPSERPVVEGAEFYLAPRIASGLRLGEIVHKGNEYRVVLTPHCHLVVQQGDAGPRSDFVLTARAVPGGEIFEKYPLKGSAKERENDLRRRIQSPSGFGKPNGRYWFLPGFMEMDHCFVDFMQVRSLSYNELSEDWTTFAILDVPFAEAMQSCFVHFYSAVGLPILDSSKFTKMGDQSPATP
jgi:hypothetical protein